MVGRADGVHGFAPVFKGAARPWQAGVLYNRDPPFADILLALLKREEGLLIGDNEPYSVSEASDYTILVHGERRGPIHVEIEIRQDLIADTSGQRAWGAPLARLLPWAYQELVAAGVPRPACGPAPAPTTSPSVLIVSPPGGGLSAAQIEPSIATRCAPTVGEARSGGPPIKERQ